MLARNMQSALYAQQRLSDQFSSTVIRMMYIARMLAHRKGFKKVTSNNLEVKIGDRTAYAAKVAPDGKVSESKGGLSPVQLKGLQDYIAADKGAKFANAPDVEFRVNGKTLYEMKDGIVVQNDLPTNLRELAKAQKLFPLPVAEKAAPILVALNQQTKDTPLQQVWSAASGLPSEPMTQQAEPIDPIAQPNNPTPTKDPIARESVDKVVSQEQESPMLKQQESSPVAPLNVNDPMLTTAQKFAIAELDGAQSQLKDYDRRISEGMTHLKNDPNVLATRKRVEELQDKLGIKPNLKDSLQAQELFEKASNILTVKGQSEHGNPSSRTWSAGGYTVRQTSQKDLTIMHGTNKVLSYPGDNNKIDVNPSQAKKAIEFFDQANQSLVSEVSKELTTARQANRAKDHQIPGLDLEMNR
jgi:hypothetical protein